MTKLDQLIEELCPDGVEYQLIEKVCDISGGKDHKALKEGGVPVYGSGGVIRYVDSYIYDRESVLIPRKGSLSNLYYVNTPFWVVDTIFYTKIDENVINPKYFYYYLKTLNLAKMNTAGGVPSLTRTLLNKILVPIPPLPVQEEIVRILDKFTALEVELETELEARKKQYEYYIDRLLTFDETIPLVELCKLAKIGTGSSNTNEAMEGGEYPFFVRSQDVLRKNTFEFDETAIITSGDGVGVGKIFHYVEGKYALHQRAYRIHFKDKAVIPKYFFFYMRNEFLKYIQRRAVHASVTSVRKWMLDEFPVPIPPLPVQERIISTLNRFDALVHDISQGLPAEIEARRRQYEYYRNKLLTFKGVES